ncbi:toxin-antitoxin system HicB family antitoxin [Alicyclobacillus cycloheptanicus]|uniref:Antitoxin HicB n=1 Tax=Alicyclobacillus cycloheptanicus TaxID=1457 RepID=A0ABT9XF65_9BACL|nr:toxin-antitoxin system HicB family antitoxin [Alicyclobacillus cycloheptanicus]MDQ0188837.1 antitoxin HicB [Alicyclobacillus cycloheptanicus]WDM00516.1 toxin-antitoxin system HicB family antitoxin [Alicyclobacillus cycloheptanicus]
MADKNLDYYLSLPYTITLMPDTVSGGYVATINELPGCITQGENVEEAIRMIEDAKRGWIEVALEDGQDIPEPARAEDFSGKFNVRVPKSLHRTLVEKAKEEGVSLNQYINYQLARSVGTGRETESIR